MNLTSVILQFGAGQDPNLAVLAPSEPSTSVASKNDSYFGMSSKTSSSQVISDMR